MDSSSNTPKSIDEYISRFPAEVRVILQTLRKVIHEAAPDATEKISYQMPTFMRSSGSGPPKTRQKRPAK